MDSILILGIGMVVSSVIVGGAGIFVAYLYTQTTIYRQGQLNYRAALKAQSDMRAQPHEGSDGGMFSELAPLMEILSRPDMKPLVDKFLSGSVPQQANTGVKDDGRKIS